MRLKTLLSISTILISTTLMSQNTKDSGSYAIGLNLAQILEKQNISSESLNLELLQTGLADGIKDSAKMSEADMNQWVRSFIMESRNAQATANLNKGLAFLAENGKKEGVTTTSSGLQYKIIKKGIGAIPADSNTVKTHYTGKLINGQIFDSSVKRGQPATFPVNGVIKGWVEALQLMPVGSKWELYIPAHLAYGANGTPDGSIPPNSTLIFEIELLDIVE